MSASFTLSRKNRAFRAISTNRTSNTFGLKTATSQISEGSSWAISGGKCLSNTVFALGALNLVQLKICLCSCWLTANNTRWAVKALAYYHQSCTCSVSAWWACYLLVYANRTVITEGTIIRLFV